MKDKMLMVAGVGSSKIMQLLFTFYLSYRFDHSVLATFILIVTLAAAMSSIASLGSSPQIVRAGAYANPRSHIESIVGMTCLILIISLIALSGYIFFGSRDFFISGFNQVDFLICAIAITISFVLYSIIQSYLSFKQKYLALGFFSIFIYFFPFISAVVLSVIVNNPVIIILYYSLSFLFSSLLVFFIVLKGNVSIVLSLKTLISEVSLLKKIVDYLKVSAFGFITMLSLYISMKNVNLNYTSNSAAIYSVSFQFFQIGIFLPSVLGSVFVPKLVKSNNVQDKEKMKKTYMFISLVWLFCCSIAFYPLFKIYKFDFSTDYVLTFLVMQCCVIFASIQAFYIQNCVAVGNFFLLTIVSLLWGGVLLISQNLLPMNVVYSSISLLISYIISNTFLYLSRQN